MHSGVHVRLWIEWIWTWNSFSSQLVKSSPILLKISHLKSIEFNKQLRTMSQEKGMEVNLATLSIQQLDQFKSQCIQEIQMLQQSLANLKMVQQSFISSEQSLDQLKPIQQDKEILVPLTGSLYVPGKLKSSDRVLVDIGTGQEEFFLKSCLTDSVFLLLSICDWIQKRLLCAEACGRS